MKKLDTKVNIIPIIAKADTISKTELQKFKVHYVSAEIILLYPLSGLQLSIESLCISEQNHIRVAKQWNTHLSISNR